MKSCLLLIISLALVGCNTNPPLPLPPKPIVNTITVYPNCTPPKRTKLNLREVQWQVIPNQSGQMVFALTPDMYADLGYNTSMTILAIKELKAEVTHYIHCLTPPTEES